MTDITSIPGVETVHARTSWQDPAKPITGPLCIWSQIRAQIAHYTADDNLIDGDPGEHATNLPAYLRQIQASYIASRGYSVGYWWAVDWLGGAWQLRGWEFKSAANLGRKVGSKANNWTAPILYLVDGSDRLTVEAARTGRAIGVEIERRAGRPIGRPLPHSAIDPTGCCGDGIRTDITAGLLDPGIDIRPEPPPPLPSPQLPAPQPTPPAPILEDDMTVKLVIKDQRVPHAVWISDGVVKTWVNDGAVAAQLDLRIAESAGGTKPSPWDGLVYREFKHSDDAVIASYGVVVGPIPAGFDQWGRKVGV